MENDILRSFSICTLDQILLLNMWHQRELEGRRVWQSPMKVLTPDTCREDFTWKFF